ncbi:MAG: tetratricopeptide repeat protein [Saprospiraceae bacterium]|nr:tetratricopeptide repeat protein [Saprospiraceae bacterium]
MWKISSYTGSAILMIMISCGGNEDSANTSTEVTQDSSSQTLETIDTRIMAGDSSADLFFQRAQLYFKDKELDKAARDIITAIRKDSSKVEYFYFLSDVQLNALQSRRALKSLEKAVALDPQNRTSLLKLMELQILLKRYVPALSTSQRLLTLDQQDHEVFFLRGLLFKEQNNDSLAIVNLQRAVDLDPEMTSAFIILGDLHEKKSSPLAEGYYRNAVRSGPEDFNALHAYAFYLQNHGKPEKALEQYSTMMRIDSTSPAPYLNSAVILMESGDHEGAIPHLNTTIERDSTFTLAYYYLGQCLREEGNISGARSAFEKAIELDPRYTEAKEELKAL